MNGIDLLKCGLSDILNRGAFTSVSLVQSTRITAVAVFYLLRMLLSGARQKIIFIMSLYILKQSAFIVWI